TIIVMPGSSGGALEVRRVIAGRTGSSPTVAETSTLPWAARIEGDRSVRIVHRVGLVRLAALPGSETVSLVETLRPVIPGLEPAGSVLETMLCNGNPVIHPAVMLLNAGTVERSGGAWEFYEEGVTPTVAALIRAVDEERLALGRAAGIELLPEPEMSRRQGYSETADYLTAYRDGPGFQNLGGPATLEHRYLTEDVACGMVTWLELAAVLGVEMPVCEAIVRLASTALGRDLRAQSRRGLTALGLAGMTARELLDAVGA
ncbi:MAG: NAD/NADP octopine/nopaline dehydrogenase family protein, partial [Armatimonadetes bacterium]|nr:NAD/NADP octopine/nopaline dehydrogenase family protein [Armatimonadota bacterium]